MVFFNLTSGLNFGEYYSLNKTQLKPLEENPNIEP
jgi:hypothetical protein